MSISENLVMHELLLIQQKDIVKLISIVDLLWYGNCRVSRVHVLVEKTSRLPIITVTSYHLWLLNTVLCSVGPLWGHTTLDWGPHDLVGTQGGQGHVGLYRVVGGPLSRLLDWVGPGVDGIKAIFVCDYEWRDFTFNRIWHLSELVMCPHLMGSTTKAASS